MAAGSLGITELIILHGDTPRAVQMPLAASQLLEPGEPVQILDLAVTRLIAASATWDTDTPAFGFIAQPSYTMVRGVKTPLPVGSLVQVIPMTGNMLWNLPSYGAAPVLATHFLDGANTTGYVVYNDAGVYKVNLAVATKGVLRPITLDPSDVHSFSGAPTWKTTPVVGDRCACAVLAAGKQVLF